MTDGASDGTSTPGMLPLLGLNLRRTSCEIHLDQQMFDGLGQAQLVDRKGALVALEFLDHPVVNEVSLAIVLL